MLTFVIKANEYAASRLKEGGDKRINEYGRVQNRQRLRCARPQGGTADVALRSQD